jgi:hypothetical protein
LTVDWREMRTHQTIHFYLVRYPGIVIICWAMLLAVHFHWLISYLTFFFSNVLSLKSRDRFFLCSFSQFQEKQITLMHYFRWIEFLGKNSQSWKSCSKTEKSKFSGNLMKRLPSLAWR